MDRKLIKINPEEFPPQIAEFLHGADIYDSSSSPEARVLFSDKEQGFFIKSAAKGTLAREAAMTRYFHTKALTAPVLAYVTDEKDWLVTEKITGDDCTSEKYLSSPEKLCDTLAERLAILHSMDFSNCPAPNHTAQYMERVVRNHKAEKFEADLFPPDWGFPNAEEAFAVIEKYADRLETNTLLHGDYCLPNIILDNWRFSGFIDLDSGGVGDRHLDIFWGTWTFVFNLKTNKYYNRFIDCYGRDRVDTDRLRLIAACEMIG